MLFADCLEGEHPLDKCTDCRVLGTARQAVRLSDWTESIVLDRWFLDERSPAAPCQVTKQEEKISKHTPRRLRVLAGI